jgi:hypothetical protein
MALATAHETPAAASQTLHEEREQVLKYLAEAIDHWSEGTLPADIAESVLILGDPQHPVIRRVLWHGARSTRAVLFRLLQESRHPGVLQFLTDSLHERYPHPQVFAAIQQRRDGEFIAALLRSVEHGVSPPVAQNLQQVDRLAWLSLPLEHLDIIPLPLQPALVTFVEATQIPREQKAAVLEWLLRHGTTPAKLAATERLSLIDEETARDVVRENLSAADAAVQAWATAQLRHVALPDAYALLVRRLDSPLPEVREAARRELAGFNTEMVLALADEWSQEQAHRAGQLLLRIDPDALDKLRSALWHPSPQKRIRNLRSIVHLGLHDRLADVLAALVHDPDPMVRRVVAEALAAIPTETAELALLVLLEDEHPRVRDTAATMLQRREHTAASSTEGRL